MSTVAWTISMNVQEGQMDALKSLMEEMVTATKDEAGTTGYEWFIGADGKTCSINEHYTDSAAALLHIGNFGSKFAERFMACLEPTSLTVYGEPNDEARAALDGFGAVYMGPFGGFRR
jgi:quinol monooxygenase YgiN